MSDGIAAASSEVESAREKLAKATETAISTWELGVRRASERLVERAVFDQPEHTATIEPADLAMLKFNVGQSVESAVSGVRGAVGRIDAEKLADKARLNSTGDSFVHADEILSPLLRPIGDLLSSAGYKLHALRRSSLDDDYRISEFEEGYTFATTARELDEAIEQYGKAKRRLEAVELDRAKSGARDAWNNAG